MEEDNAVLAKYNELKELVATLELDAAKNSNGTAAAGVRLRKGLRLVKTKAGELVKLTVELDKKKKES